jgi:hypothetical protein
VKAEADGPADVERIDASRPTLPLAVVQEGRGEAGRVVVQQTFNGGWKKVASIATDRFGVAQKLLRVEPIGKFRAVFGKRSEKSLPFSMRIPRDQFFNPFGQTTLLEPKGTPCSASVAVGETSSAARPT